MKLTSILSLLLGLGFFAAAAQGAPTLADVSPRGLQAGGTTTLTFVGAELGPQSSVLLALPGVKQAVKPGGQPNQVQIDVTLDKSAPAGIYHVRLATESGVSSPLAIGVDELPQQPFAAELAKLPAALHGQLTGGTVLETRFSGRAGQRVVVDLEARRLGGALNPMLELVAVQGRQLAYSPGLDLLGGDARLEATLPADGQYTVRLFDAFYRGGGPGHFRLKIGELKFADLVLPLGVQRGKQATVEAASSNLPPGTKWTQLSDSPFDVEPAAWPQGIFTGGRPRVFVSDLPEVAEAPPTTGAAGALQEVAAPAGITGRLLQQGEVDRYLLKVKPGMRLRFDVLAERLGSPMDAILTIEQPGGGQLAAADDGANTTDPTLDFTVPAGVEKVHVVLRDQTAQGGPANIYHIGVTELRPDFSLAALADRVQVPQAGLAHLRVRAQRAGYNGAIQLRFVGGLPNGVSLVGPDTIPAGASDVLLALRAEGNAVGAAVVAMIGAPVGGDAVGPRPVLAIDSPTAQHQPWLRRELAIAVTRPVPLQLAWEDSAAGTSLVQGMNQPLGVKVTRGAGAAGPVRLSLLTSQLPPIVTAEGPNKGKPDPNQTLRVDAAVMIPANQDRGALPLVVPGATPMLAYDLAVNAELLSTDGQRVVAEAVSLPRRVTVAPKPQEKAKPKPAPVEKKKS